MRPNTATIKPSIVKTERRLDAYRCSHCGQLIAGTSTSYLGYGGKYLCSKCVVDPAVLEQFMEDGSRAVRTVIDTMMGLSGGAVARR
jgi:phage FluMu protein Com